MTLPACLTTGIAHVQALDLARESHAAFAALLRTAPDDMAAIALGASLHSIAEIIMARFAARPELAAAVIDQCLLDLRLTMRPADQRG